MKQSTPEGGIRVAVGARRRDTLQRYLMRGLRLSVAWGVARGVAAALAVTRLMHAVLYAVSATDVASFSTAVALVLAVAAGASLPTRPVACLDPLRALRHN